MIKQFSIIRFTANGREYDVDERLVTTLDQHRSLPGAHHLYLSDGTYFCATNVTHVRVIREVREPRR